MRTYVKRVKGTQTFKLQGALCGHYILSEVRNFDVTRNPSNSNDNTT